MLPIPLGHFTLACQLRMGEKGGRGEGQQLGREGGKSELSFQSREGNVHSWGGVSDALRRQPALASQRLRDRAHPLALSDFASEPWPMKSRPSLDHLYPVLGSILYLSLNLGQVLFDFEHRC